jgi:hypothetical protein
MAATGLFFVWGRTEEEGEARRRCVRPGLEIARKWTPGTHPPTWPFLTFSPGGRLSARGTQPAADVSGSGTGSRAACLVGGGMHCMMLLLGSEILGLV